MKSAFRFDLVVAAVVVAFASPALAQVPPDFPLQISVPSLSNDQVSRLQSGAVIVDVISGSVPVGDAIGIVDARAEQIIDVIKDFGAYEDWMSDVEHSEVLEDRGGNRFLCRGETDTPWPMANRNWTVEAWGGEMQVDGVDALVSVWTYVPGSGNIADTQGYWLLIPWGDDGEKTLVRYHLRVDLGTILPDFVLEWSTENFLPAKIADLRRRVAALQRRAAQP
jgi:hypothetical protein